MKTLMMLACSAAILGAGCTTSHPRTGSWEYKVVENYLAGGNIEDQLNRLGKDGWAVVSSSTQKDQQNETKVVVILKRHKI